MAPPIHAARWPASVERRNPCQHSSSPAPMSSRAISCAVPSPAKSGETSAIAASAATSKPGAMSERAAGAISGSPESHAVRHESNTNAGTFAERERENWRLPMSRAVRVASNYGLDHEGPPETLAITLSPCGRVITTRKCARTTPCVSDAVRVPVHTDRGGRRDQAAWVRQRRLYNLRSCSRSGITPIRFAAMPKPITNRRAPGAPASTQPRGLWPSRRGRR